MARNKEAEAGQSGSSSAMTVVPNSATTGGILPPAAPEGRTAARGFDPVLWLARYGTLTFLGLLIVFFAVRNPRFLSLQNGEDILAAISYLAIMAAGATVILSMLEFDLSVGYIAGLAAATFAFLSRGYQVTWEGFFAGLAVAGLCGLFNGLIVTRLKITSFIATLAASFVYNGAIIWLTAGQLISTGMTPGFYSIGQGTFLGLRNVAYVMVLVLIVLWVLMERTPFGRQLYAIGGNRVAARLSGIKVQQKVLIGFVITGLTAGLSGLLLASNLGQADPTASLGLLFDGFTAVFLGSAVLRAGQVHIFGTLVGAVTLGVMLNGMTFMNLDFASQTIAKGAVLIVAVAISQLARNRR